jgi:hypothetical protein
MVQEVVAEDLSRTAARSRRGREWVLACGRCCRAGLLFDAVIVF